MNVLIDTSVWVDYFRSGKKTGVLDFLIDENLIVTNDLILTELIPFLKVKNQKPLISLLDQIRRLSLTIIWSEIIELQIDCLRGGINGVGIPDLIIANNAIQNNTPIYALDGHFKLISTKTKLKLFDEKTK